MKSFILSLFVFLSSTAFAKDRIDFHIETHPKSLDPAANNDWYGRLVISNIVETLMTTDKNGKLVHGLAKSHEISPDGLIYRFTLRPDARWSDGVPVTADHCVNGLVPRLSHQVNGVRVYQDKNDLVIKLEKTVPHLLELLTSLSLAPRRQDAPPLGTVGAPANGRYIVTKNDTEIVLSPNPVNSRPGQLPIHYHATTDLEDALRRFEKGEWDVLTLAPAAELPRLIAQGFSRAFPTTQVTYLVFNFAKPPFNDRDLRRAIAAAVNRNNIKAIQPDIYTPTRSYFAAGLTGHFEYNEIQFSDSLERVKSTAILRDLSFTYMAGSSIRDQIAGSVAADVEKNLGKPLKLIPVEWSALNSAIESDAPAIYMLGSSPGLNNPLTLLDSFIFTPGYPTPEYRDLLTQIREAAKEEQREALALKAHKILIEEAIVIPLVQVQKRLIVNKRLQSFDLNPFGFLRADEIR
jgi:oligopeptide transport system substrate-binding protein